MINTTFLSGDDSFQPTYSTTIELSMPMLTLPHMSLTYLNPPLLPSSSHSHLTRETSSPANQSCTHNTHTVTGSHHNAPYMAHTALVAHEYWHTSLYVPFLLVISHIYSSFPPISHKFPSISCNIETSSSRLLYHWSPIATLIEHSFQKHNPQGVQHRPQSQHPMQKPSPSQHRM